MNKDNMTIKAYIHSVMDVFKRWENKIYRNYPYKTKNESVCKGIFL